MLDKKFEKIFALDTNIILNDASYIIKLSQNGNNLILLPETVIDELDSKKSGFDEINFQSREFARLLSDAVILGTKDFDGIKIISIQIYDNIFLDLISIDEYEVRDSNTKISNDMKIIECIRRISGFYDITIQFLSIDVMCRTRAITHGIDVASLHNNHSNEYKFEFIKELEVDLKTFESIRAGEIQILDIDKEYLPENYSYRIKYEDYFLNTYIVNGVIKIIDGSELNRSNIKPLNDGQLYALSGMLDNELDIVIIDALAGTGKTLLALSAGMRLVQTGQFDKIIYIRNSIESTNKGEEVGFLSGNDEKFKIYNYPLYDSLEYFINKQLSKKEKNTISQDTIDSRIDEIMAKFKITTVWPGSIRGRTIRNAFVVIDECQNFSQSTMQTVISRIDENSKIICIGSNKQIDNPYVNKYTNGLNVLLNQTKVKDESVSIFATTLDKVVRGRITEWAERIF